MKKIFIITVGCIITLLLSQKTFAFNNGDYLEVKNFIEDNIEEMTQSYFEVYNEAWEATYVKDIITVSDKYYEDIGYLVILDRGYIAYKNDLSVLEMETEGYPSFYNPLTKNDMKVIYHSGRLYDENNDNQEIDYLQSKDLNAVNIYYPLEEYYQRPNFSINHSMTRIPHISWVDKNSSEWGRYTPISFGYGIKHCGGVLSTMSLMYTLKVHNIVDMTPPKESYIFLRSELYHYVDYVWEETGHLISVMQLQVGVNGYLDVNFPDKDYVLAIVQMLDPLNPQVIFYFNNNPYASANYCLRVGHAQEPNFWVFKTYYDIVMADADNFFNDSNGTPTMWDDLNITPYYVVNQNYRNEMFQFFDGDKLLALY